MHSQKELDEFLKKQKENFNKFLDNVKDLNRNAESEIYKQDQLRKEIEKKNKEIQKLEAARIQAQKVLNSQLLILNDEERKELEELVRTFQDKRADLEDSIKDFNKQIRNIPKDAQITKEIKTSLGLIAKNLGQSIKGATANVQKVLDVNSDEYRKEVLQDIADLSKSKDGRDRAFKKLNDAVEEGAIMLSDFSDFGDDFVGDFKKFQKNARNLEKQQSEARRMGVATVVDEFKGTIRALSGREIFEKQKDLKRLEKQIQENELKIKKAAEAGDRVVMDELMKMNESLFKETQKLADMGIKTRNMFEKSMFKPQFVADLQDSFSQITVAGKTLGERKGEIGEFFDGITPGPIQDAFRGVTSAISPVTSMFKEFAKPLKIFPFLFNQLKKGQKQSIKNLQTSNKQTAQQNKLQKANNKIQKTANKQAKVGILANLVSGVVNFFKTFLTMGPTFLLIVTALTGAFFTFKSVLGPLLEKMGLAVKSEDAKSEIDARKNLKTRMKEISLL